MKSPCKLLSVYMLISMFLLVMAIPNSNTLSPYRCLPSFWPRAHQLKLEESVEALRTDDTGFPPRSDSRRADWQLKWPACTRLPCAAAVTTPSAPNSTITLHSVTEFKADGAVWRDSQFDLF